MSEILTLKEIEEKYDSQWVLIGDVQTNERYELLGGKVLYHGDSREEAYEKVDEFNPRFFAVRWIGEVKSESIFIL